jgi:fatty acid desaturase
MRKVSVCAWSWCYLKVEIKSGIMRNTIKFSPSLFTVIVTLFAALWLVLLITGSISLVGNLIFVLVAAWFFELFSASQERT